MTVNFADSSNEMFLGSVNENINQNVFCVKYPKSKIWIVVVSKQPQHLLKYLKL